MIIKSKKVMIVVVVVLVIVVLARKRGFISDIVQEVIKVYAPYNLYVRVSRSTNTLFLPGYVRDSPRAHIWSHAEFSPTRCLRDSPFVLF